jgi:hypothetical protein
MKRYPISKIKSRKAFRKTVDLTPRINIQPRPMRGGIRL